MKLWSEMSEEEIRENLKKCVDECNKNNKVNGYNVKVSIHKQKQGGKLNVLKNSSIDFKEYKT